MRTIVPGSVSPTYLKALRETQVKFFQSITMSDEQAKRIREEYPIDGINSTKHPRLNETRSIKT